MVPKLQDDVVSQVARAQGLGILSPPPVRGEHDFRGTLFEKHNECSRHTPCAVRLNVRKPKRTGILSQVVPKSPDNSHRKSLLRTGLEFCPRAATRRTRFLWDIIRRQAAGSKSIRTCDQRASASAVVERPNDFVPRAWAWSQNGYVAARNGAKLGRDRSRPACFDSDFQRANAGNPA